MPPNMPPNAPGLLCPALDNIGHKKGRNPYFYWVDRPLWDCKKQVLVVVGGLIMRNETMNHINLHVINFLPQLYEVTG